MANQFGRISGPLLADNLKRNGINLAFDNQVLYLDVVNNRVGFNSLSPVNDLFTPTAIDSIGLLVDNTADIGNFIISTNTIQNPLGTITISPNQASNPTIVVPQLSTANLLFSGNTISDIVQDDSINITANGTGLINLNNNTVVTGNLHATGNITWAGNITFGNTNFNLTPYDQGPLFPSFSSNNVRVNGNWFIPFPLNSGVQPGWQVSYVVGGVPASATVIAVNTNVSMYNVYGSTYVTGDQIVVGTYTMGAWGYSTPIHVTPTAPTNIDTITFAAEVNSNILPSTTNTDDLGSNSLQWLTAYASNLNSSTAVISNSATVTNLTLGNIRFNSNNISNVNSSNTISFVTSGTGVVNFNGTNYVNVNSINSPLGNLVLASTGDGFVQFNGTAIAIPLGDIATRPNSPQVGTMRFNTDLQYEEVFDGTTWLQLSGIQTKNLTEDQIADTTWTWDIILG
jgi:hypothetical protein